MPLHDKIPEEKSSRKNIFQYNKGYIWQHITNIFLSGENLKVFSLKLRMIHGWPLSPLLFNLFLDFSAREIRQEKEINGHKEKNKLNYPHLQMLWFPILKRHQRFQQKNFRPDTFSKVTGHKINIQKSVAFLYTNDEFSEKKKTGNGSHS
jgi:hypothetical protein